MSFSAEVAADDVEPVDDEPSLDLQNTLWVQIREHVERNFHGHALSDLVAAVLEAEGIQSIGFIPRP